MTKDILLRIKAQLLELCAEDFISEQVLDHERQYTGRCEVYAPDELFKDFKKKGIPVDEICTVMDYFEIFLERMIMCRRAAERLECKFKLIANGNKMY